MSINLEGANSGTFCLSKVGLGIGTTTSQIATAAAGACVIDGVHQASKALSASFAIAAASGHTLSTVPVGSKSAFGVWLNSAGAYVVTQGPVSVVNSNSDKVGPPAHLAGGCIVGAFTVYGGTAAFVPATTALNAAGVTTTYFDLFSYPTRGL